MTYILIVLCQLPCWGSGRPTGVTTSTAPSPLPAAQPAQPFKDLPPPNLPPRPTQEKQPGPRGETAGIVPKKCSGAKMLLEIGNFNHKSIFHVFVCFPKNITRGSTDPEVGHQMTPLTLVANLAIRCRHLHKLQIWPSDGTTYNNCKFGHQMARLALVYIPSIASLSWISVLALSASFDLVSSSVRVTSVKSTQRC